MNRTLRVGIVCPYSFARPGGVQNHIIGLAGWLRRHGHSVAILAPGRADADVLRRAGVRPEDFTSAGPAVPVTYNGSVARINFGPVTAVRVRDWLDEGYFDLLHLHEPMTPSVSLLALAQTWLPVTATFHTATPGSRAMEVAYQVLPGASSRVDAPIAVSTMAAEVVERYAGISPQVIGNGIDIHDHHAMRCATTWRGGDHPRITFIGRYDEPRKGFDVLLDALPTIRAAHPDVEVHVVGSGDPRRVDGVTFLGPLSDRERNDALSNSDVYVAPQTGRESFGIVLLEAMASGAPVVASDLQAFREVVTDERGPIADLFETGDPQSLAAAVRTSLGRPRDERLARGRARAREFDWDVLAPRVVGAYREAIARGASLGPRQPGLVTGPALARAAEILDEAREWTGSRVGAAARSAQPPRLEG